MLRFGYNVEHAPEQRCRGSSYKAMPKSSAASFGQTSKGKPGLRVAAAFLQRRKDYADPAVSALVFLLNISSSLAFIEFILLFCFVVVVVVVLG